MRGNGALVILPLNIWQAGVPRTCSWSGCETVLDGNSSWRTHGLTFRVRGDHIRQKENNSFSCRALVIYSSSVCVFSVGSLIMSALTFIISAGCHSMLERNDTQMVPQNLSETVNQYRNSLLSTGTHF